MVLRCAWGTCNGDQRYPNRLQGARLVRFPKPKTQLNRCMRWITACGRPHSQLNINKIDQHKAVCSIVSDFNLLTLFIFRYARLDFVFFAAKGVVNFNQIIIKQSNTSLLYFNFIILLIRRLV